MSAARRPRGLEALGGIPTITPDDPARRGEAEPAPAPAQSAAAPAQPTEGTTPQRPQTPPTRRRAAAPTAGSARRRASSSGTGEGREPTTPSPSGRATRSDVVPRSYVVPAAVADTLRATSRALKMSDSGLVNELLRTSLTDLPSLARFTQGYIEWRETTDADLTSVRVSTQTPRSTVDELERVTARLDEAIRQSSLGRMSLSRVVAIVLFGHFYDERTGELAPDEERLRKLRADAQRAALERQLAALTDDA